MRAERRKADNEFHAEARQRAHEKWEAAKPETGEHRYLRDKGVGAHGLRTNGFLVYVPVRDTEGTLHGLQYISPSGEKKFLTGTAVRGNCHAIGKSDSRILITEGYATAATLHEVTGHAVAVAFDCGNLPPVAQALRAKHPEMEIVICADDDQWAEGNPGLTKAREAAIAVGGKLAVPQFKDTIIKPTDFNDLRRLEEEDVVRRCVEAATKPKAPKETDGEVFKRLAALSPVEYDRVRDAEAQQLGVRVSTLDAEVRKARGETTEDTGQGQAFVIKSPEPWPEFVDGGALVREIAATLERYVLLPQGAALVIAFWVLHAHCFDLSYHTPRLNVTAPQLGCGKSTLLDVLEPMLPRAVRLENLSTAVFFRLAQNHMPCFLIDEYDKFLKRNEELLGGLNAGHKRGGQFARCEGDSNEVRLFGVFCPAVLAGIGALPTATLTNRSIVIHMMRARQSEIAKRFDGRYTDAERTLNEKASRWVCDHRAQLSIVDPKLPDGFYNRRADNWRPLFSVAGVLGGDWPAKLTEAALAVIGEEEPDETLAILLLKDIRDLFQERKTGRLRSQDLAEALGRMEDRPWFQFGRTGKPITQNAVARMLKPFRVYPKTVRFEVETKKGYLLEFFTEVFSRFIEDEGIQTVTPSQANNDAASSGFQTVTSGEDVTVANPCKPNDDAGCYGVTDEKVGARGKGEDPKPKGWEIQI